jgi:hypothetical protein
MRRKTLLIYSKTISARACRFLLQFCICIFLFSSSSFGQSLYDSGTEFLHVCSVVERVQSGSKSPTDKASLKACESYVVGLADGVGIQHLWSSSHGDKTKAGFCVDFQHRPASDVDEAIHMILQYIRENPDRARYSTGISVEEALHKEFPCK